MDDSALLWTLLKVIALLAGMLVLARFLPRWLNRSQAMQGRHRHLKLLDVLHIGYDRTIYVVEVDQVRLVVGASRQGLKLLATLDRPVGEAEED